jgi:hypothetical protein
MLYDRRAATHPRTPSTNATKTLVRSSVREAAASVRALARAATRSGNDPQSERACNGKGIDAERQRLSYKRGPMRRPPTRHNSSFAIRSPCAAIRAASCSMTRCCPSCSSPKSGAHHKMWSSSCVLFPLFWRLLYVSRILFAISQGETQTSRLRCSDRSTHMASPQS